MLGNLSTWSQEHTDKFAELHEEHKQVAIFVHNDEFHEFSQTIDGILSEAGYSWQTDYIIELLPNIGNVHHVESV